MPQPMLATRIQKSDLKPASEAILEFVQGVAMVAIAFAASAALLGRKIRVLGPKFAINLSSQHK